MRNDEEYVYLFPHSLSKKKEPVQQKRKTFWNEKCRRKWRFVCSLNCKCWIPEKSK